MPAILKGWFDRVFVAAARKIHDAVARLATARPLPSRRQNGGDYDTDLVLRAEHAPGQTGLEVHYERAREDHSGLAALRIAR